MSFSAQYLTGPEMSLNDQTFQEGASGTITINVESTKFVPGGWVELTILEKPNSGMYI